MWLSVDEGTTETHISLAAGSVVCGFFTSEFLRPKDGCLAPPRKSVYSMTAQRWDSKSLPPQFGASLKGCLGINVPYGIK